MLGRHYQHAQISKKINGGLEQCIRLNCMNYDHKALLGFEELINRIVFHASTLHCFDEELSCDV